MDLFHNSGSDFVKVTIDSFDNITIKETSKIFGTVLEALKIFLDNDFESERTYPHKKIFFTSLD